MGVVGGGWQVWVASLLLVAEVAGGMWFLSALTVVTLLSPATLSPANLSSSGAPPQCQDGLIFPAWRPIHNISMSTRFLRGSVYFFVLLYLFLGVSIISDRFMSAIEVITSQEKKVTVRIRGEKKTILVRVWNETVANLTLMALGSSAPEILLSIIEIWGKNFEAGELGPGTIVGSAAYNLFVIIAICVSVIPKGETRKIKGLRVFFVTATWSVFAYIWLYIILAVISEGVVEVWEGILTFLFFPLTVLTAYMADRKIPFYKLPLMLFRLKKHGAVGAAECADIEMSRSDNGGVEDMLEEARQQSANLLKDLRQRYPEKTLAELKAMAQEEIEELGLKSRAFYRIQATRSLTGGSVIHRNVVEPSTNHDGAIPHSLVDDTNYVRFEKPECVVLENAGSVIVKVLLDGPGVSVPLLVDYQSEDGTAIAGTDYTTVSGTLVFKPGSNEQCFKIKILDDDVFEEDEHFFVRLSNVRAQSQEQGENVVKARVGRPDTLRLTILDDDHCGVFEFSEGRAVEVCESVGRYEAEVIRRSGARGQVEVAFRTKEGTAKAGKDYIHTQDVLLFENNQSRKTIPLQINSENSYERNVTLYIQLEKPRPAQLEKPSPDHLDSVNRVKSSNNPKVELIAQRGYPVLGESSVLAVTIRESLEFKDIVDQLAETRTSPFIIGTKSWSEQFAAAFRVKDEVGDEGPTCCDYFIHFLTIFWKVIFAFVPPAECLYGYLCFTLSIVWIGILTAVIGDIASHFGCTVGLADAVTSITFVALGTSVPEYLHGWICFTVSILWIGVLTTAIGDVASAFGCTAAVKDQITAISLVAMGTSLPDTFASKVAAIQDKTADNSVGNVTGSNAVNVFLGIGIAWSLAAVHHSINGKAFLVPPGNLAFSVTIFCSEACVAMVIIVARRCKAVGGELGGPTVFKYLTTSFFIFLWLFYLTMSTLEAYNIVQGF